MKYAYAFLAPLLFVGASTAPIDLVDEDGALNDLDYDLVDFVKLIPLGKFHKVVEDHVDDPELWKTIKYLLSDDFHKLVYAAEDLPEFHKYVLYLQKVGYNAYRELRQTHVSLGMKDYVPPKEPKQMNLKKGGGFSSFLDDLIAILPKEAIKEMHQAKLEESPAFVKFIAALRSSTFSKVKSDLYNEPTMKNLLQQAKAHGFDFEKYFELRHQIIGFA